MNCFLRKMYNSWLFLTRFLREITPEIKGKFLISVHTQQRNLFHLTFGREANSEENIILEFSSAANAPYLIKKKYFKPANKNLIRFFKDELPQRLPDIKIAFGERVILLLLENASIFIVFRGNDSNIFFAGADFIEKESVRKTEVTLAHILSADLDFIDPNASFEKRIAEKITGSKNLKKELPFLGKEVLERIISSTPHAIISDEQKGQEFQTNTGRNNQLTALGAEQNGQEFQTNTAEKVYEEIIHSVLFNSIFLVKAAGGFPVLLLPESFVKDEERIEQFNSLLTGLERLVATVGKETADLQLRKKLTASVKKELTHYRQKAENLEQVLQSGEKSEFYDKVANLLMINRDKIQKGAEKVALMDIFNDEEEMIINLKGDISLNENIERYFRKARGEKLRFENAASSLNATKQKISELETQLKSLEKMERDELKELGKATLPASQGEKKGSVQYSRVRRFTIDEKWEVLVGKDSESNDTLTLKIAKQSDYWFHARGSSGSHTVLRFSGKEKPPKEILKKTAQIAAFYSKAKNSKLVPVAYTQKKYVVKRKGMPPGKVALLREDVVMVPPVIPDGCRLDTDN
ncbi:MAG: hypothetical protein IFNCLDLE_01817 [Ignavibacteriaceae bacterium]|nr:hypothetical protein [Ignavibacteriaceae bacterium]